MLREHIDTFQNAANDSTWRHGSVGADEQNGDSDERGADAGSDNAGAPSITHANIGDSHDNTGDSDDEEGSIHRRPTLWMTCFIVLSH
jgi:hypothetical protein